MKRDQKSRKRFLGGSRPFGYAIGIDGELTPDIKEQSVLAEARKLRAQGASLRVIADAVQAKGFQVSHVTIGKALSGLPSLTKR